MKKLLIIFILASIPIFSQIYDMPNGSGFWFNDSLYTTYVDTNATPDDTLSESLSLILPLHNNYDWLYFCVYDTGATYDDSIVVEQGVIQMSGNSLSPTYGDTTWINIAVKDSTWTTINVLVDDDAIHGYTVYTPLMDLIRIRETNTATDSNNVTWIYGEVKRSK